MDLQADGQEPGQGHLHHQVTERSEQDLRGTR